MMLNKSNLNDALFHINARISNFDPQQFMLLIYVTIITYMIETYKQNKQMIRNSNLFF